MGSPDFYAGQVVTVNIDWLYLLSGLVRGEAYPLLG